LIEGDSGADSGRLVGLINLPSIESIDINESKKEFILIAESGENRFFLNTGAGLRCFVAR
jgi:hypothetical protein